MRIYIFTGLSGVGKSTIARRLANALHLPLLGEREIIHSLAKSQGYTRGRDWLKAVGSAEPILTAINHETIKQIRQYSHSNLIIDGSYDPNLLTMIRTELPDCQITIINVVAEEVQREQHMGERLGGRGDAVKEEMIWIDGWKQRVGMQQIIDRADITITNGASLERAIQQIARELRIHLIRRETTPPKEILKR